MGDRVAVLSAGVLQQVDSPRALYDDPANAFVAAFIGSPSMNLVEVPIVEGGVRLGDGVVPIERAILSQVTGNSVLLGVRPEDLRIADAGTSMTVTLVEELGADAYIYGDATATDGSVIPLIVRAPGSTPVRIGDTVKVVTERVHVFSPEGDRPRLSA